MARITTYDKLRGCYVIEPDNNQNHIQRLGELEDRDEAKALNMDTGFGVECPTCGRTIEDDGFDFCPACGQHLKWGEDNETL